jgi:hypothetical protein
MARARSGRGSTRPRRSPRSSPCSTSRDRK